MTSEGYCVRFSTPPLRSLNVSVARQNGSGELSSLQARQRRPERSSVQAALLELLATAARAGIVAPDTLERVNKRLGRIGKGQRSTPRTGGPPLLIPLGCI